MFVRVWEKIFSPDVQVEGLRDYILRHHVWTDREELFSLLLRGLEDGVMQIRAGWHQGQQHQQYLKVRRTRKC